MVQEVSQELSGEKKVQTAENVKKIPHDRVNECSKVLGVTNFEMWDYDDCMLEVKSDIIKQLNEKTGKYSQH